MPEFTKIEGSLPSPSTCFTCGSHAPPMQYLRENFEGLAVLMCPMCIVELGRTEGMHSAEEHRLMSQVVADLHAQIEELEDTVRIEQSRQVHVVTVADVKRSLDEAAPDATAPKRKLRA